MFGLQDLQIQNLQRGVASHLNVFEPDQLKNFYLNVVGEIQFPFAARLYATLIPSDVVCVMQRTPPPPRLRPSGSSASDLETPALTCLSNHR